MSKKGRIISWVIIAVLLVSVAIVVATQLMNGGAKKIDRTQFKQYVENARYYVDGDKINKLILKQDAEGNYYLPDKDSEDFDPANDIVADVKIEGYAVKDGKIVSVEIKDDNGKIIQKAGESLPVITKKIGRAHV